MVESSMGDRMGKSIVSKGLMIQRFSGFMVQWISIWAKTIGLTVFLFNGSMASHMRNNHWLNGLISQWFNAFMVRLLNGSMV